MGCGVGSTHTGWAICSKGNAPPNQNTDRANERAKTRENQKKSKKVIENT
nr:MAG TPA: hypothetical protein [Caudoviricetes sp.]